MNLPSISRCHELMRETNMLEHIRDHSILVSQVASLIARHIHQAGVSLSLPLIEISALLHDITKTRSLQTGERHAQTGARFIQKLGYPEVAQIVHQHVRLSRFSVHALPNEAEIVNYADKRVLHDRIASLSDRMRYIEDKYGVDENKRQKIKIMWLESEQLEQKLFRFLCFAPNEIEKRMQRPCMDIPAPSHDPST